MRLFPFFAILIFAIEACSISSQNKEDIASLIDTALVNTHYEWQLFSPQPKAVCDLRLSFAEDNRMTMQYRGTAYEGYYEIDSTLSNYIIINIFSKFGWDHSCEVNPAYLSLYDDDTQFSYKILKDRLYFEKNEKVIVFQRVDV